MKLSIPALALVALVGGFFVWKELGKVDQATTPPVKAQPVVPTPEPTDLLFCFWNVENLFDDKDDRRNNIDEPYDNAFARDDGFRKAKYEHLATALMKLNGGKGPDVIACVEVESVRAAELLAESLNEKIKDDKQKYKSTAMKNLDGGRHIAPCVISRYPLSQISTRLHGRYLRVLETKLIINDHELTILTSHWTSKLTRDDGSDGESGRSNYASTLAGVYGGILKKKPEADVLVCGDFNDTPEADSIVKTLRAVGDRDAVKNSANGDRPLMLDLLAGKDPAKYGTIWYDNQPRIYDHICVSPGLLDEAGWTCAPASVLTVSQGLIRPGSSRRQPWRFGDPSNNLKLEDRGFSDHFPVTVRLSVAP